MLFCRFQNWNTKIFLHLFLRTYSTLNEIQQKKGVKSKNKKYSQLLETTRFASFGNKMCFSDVQIS